jgi:hypothetical protein
MLKVFNWKYWDLLTYWVSPPTSNSLLHMFPHFKRLKSPYFVWKAAINVIMKIA